jgi:hypothetical protein
MQGLALKPNTDKSLKVALCATFKLLSGLY